MNKKFKLVEVNYIDLFHFDMYEGKFQDLEQVENGRDDVFIYANLSNFDTETYEESELRIYAHSFEDLYCPEDYELYELERRDETEEMKREILDAIKSK